MLDLLRLPTYVNSVTFRISERANIVGIYFDFDREAILSAEIAKLYYPSGGVTSKDEPGRVLLERRSRALHVAVFDHVTEAVAALALLPIHTRFSPGNVNDPVQLAADFIDYCEGRDMVAPSHNPETTRDLTDCLRRSLEAERVAQVVLKT